MAINNTSTTIMDYFKKMGKNGQMKPVFPKTIKGKQAKKPIFTML
jgi:hypothetical protein